MAAVFEARLIRVLGERVTAGVSEAGGIANEIAKFVVDDGNWMWHVARHTESGEPFNLFATVNRTDKCWRAILHFGSENIAPEFEADAPYIVLPIGVIFASVYSDCKAMLSGQSLPRKRGKPRRARS